MSLELCILASGSAGNCAVLRGPGGAVVLIDAGIGPRTAARRMGETGVRMAHVQAICLTHLDYDHFNNGWVPTILKQRVRVFCHESRAAELIERVDVWMQGRRRICCGPNGQPADFASLVHTFNGRAFSPCDAVTFRSMPVAHDEHGSHAFRIEAGDCHIGYATDLGRVPVSLLKLFEGVHILALESNYDPYMQRSSGRPWFLQQRIMGGRGHLSNAQALAAIQALLDLADSRGLPLPQHIVLLHRSRECNCPNLVRKLFATDARIAKRLILAEQAVATSWIRAHHAPPLAGEQLHLAWSAEAV